MISVIIAPLISFAPSGLYNVVQQFNGLYSMPLLAIILLGFYSKKVTPAAAKIVFVFHVAAYAFTSLFMSDIHYLYTLSVLFLADVFIMWLIGIIKPLQTPFEFKEGINKVDLTPWKHAKWVSVVVILCVVSAYIIFSPLGIAQ
jgi:SSS family solute:Na+ symporter